MTLARRDAPIEGGGLTKAGLDHTRDQLVLLENFVKGVLKPDRDYGVIPGTNGKPTLLKPGAANIVAAFNCHIEPTVDESTVDPVKSFVSYEVHVDIVSNQSGQVMARGFAQANSYEDKWRYRNASPKCPQCGKEAILKSKYKPGFYCYNKKGGCGANFPPDTEEITGQETGRVENENPLSQANTIKKIAIKRATTDAALQLPGVARFFTQDFDDQSGHPEEADDVPAEAPPAKPKGHGPAQGPNVGNGASKAQKPAGVDWPVVISALETITPGVVSGVKDRSAAIAGYVGMPWAELAAGGTQAVIEAVKAERIAREQESAEQTRERHEAKTQDGQGMGTTPM